MSVPVILSMSTPAPTGASIVLAAMFFVGVALMVALPFFYKKERTRRFWAVLLLGVCLAVNGIVFLLQQ